MRIPGIWRFQNAMRDNRLHSLQSGMDLDPSANFLVFSDPRGGSTWVTEIIQRIASCPIIWEPLWVDHVPPFKELGFSNRQFIPENAQWPEAKRQFEQLFKGRMLNYWTTKKTDPRELSNAERILLKICRGNQILPWLVKNFTFTHKPVYIIRHPFAVVSSQMKQGGWDKDFRGYTIIESRFMEAYDAERPYLDSLRTKEEALTAAWCMCNLVPLRHGRNNQDWITLNYEEFVLDPRQSTARILDEWGLDFDIDSIDFERKSSTALSTSPIAGRKQIEYWTQVLDKEQIERMLKVLEHFKVSEYDRDPYPRKVFNYG